MILYLWSRLLLFLATLHAEDQGEEQALAKSLFVVKKEDSTKVFETGLEMIKRRSDRLKLLNLPPASLPAKPNLKKKERGSYEFDPRT